MTDERTSVLDALAAGGSLEPGAEADARRRGIGVDPALLTPTPDQEELRGVVASFLAETSADRARATSL